MGNNNELESNQQPQNGQACSNHLSLATGWQLSSQVQVLKAELSGIQLKWIPSWHLKLC